MVATSTLKQACRSLERGKLKRARLSRETQRRVERYVQQARAAGASWRAVGEALGITRQSAWERFHHLPASPAQASRASRAPRIPDRQSSARQEAERIERYVQQARAAGASWQRIGEALGITRQTAWERFRHISASPSRMASPQAYSPVEQKVLGMRAVGVSWRAVGAALGITGQTAWERFRHLSTHPTRGAIPEEVLRAGDMTPHAFDRWVANAAKDPQIHQWLYTPNLALGLSTGHYGPMTPFNLLGTDGLRTFLMTAEANRSSSK
jgi:biotin operon repressor